MKKILFASAFALFGTFAMANETKEIKEEASKAQTEENCIKVNYSCGVSADICNFNGTTQQLVNMVWAQDGLICP
ncbi:hypothetical protein [Faecalibacter bovis]|uniref:Uncharacterized protein n=1 Tax=Faecalibacter bovis TaxID=2898187 RepID=A0ABX7XAH1_9FLAO|nr:hypothetical protein [Faecalibacter bovis]QTV04890.1 hypothetical protein J9309_08780 [Faecalibacter bovis]